MAAEVSVRAGRLLGVVALAFGLGVTPPAFGGDTIALLKDINPGIDPTTGTSSTPQGFTKAGGLVYFGAADGSDGLTRRLWSTDGTPEGTAPVPGSPLYAGFPTVVGETLYFSGCNSDYLCQVWKVDPVAGCVLAADVDAVRGGAPVNLAAFQGTIFFRARDASGYGLWKVNPAGGATLVKRLAGGFYAGPDSLVVMGDHLYFIGYEAGDQYRRLWRTNGSPDDVHRVGPTTLVLPANVAYLTAFGDALFFAADDLSDGHGLELWTSDGDPDIPSGTYRVMDIYPGESVPGGGLHSSVPGPFAVRDGILYFTAQNEEGRGLWTTDGTEAGTVLVKIVSPLADSPSIALTLVGDLFFFVADDGVTGRELWRSDGTFAGTFLVEDICNVYDYPGDPLACGPFQVADSRNDSSNPTGLVGHEGMVYFGAYHPEYGRELFRSDGSTVELVRDFLPGSFYSGYWDQDFPNSSGATPMADVDRILYLSLDDGVNGVEPWTLRSPAPAEEIAGIIDIITGLVDDGTLNRGQGNSFLKKLEHALDALAAGDTQKAITMLNAFVNEVQAYRNAGILDPDLADDLIARAEAAIASIVG